MEHADVRAWLDDAFFRPGVLQKVGDGDGDPRLDVVRDHLENCPECSAYATSLRRTGVALDLALGPSPQTRERTLAAVRSVGRGRGPVERAEPEAVAPAWRWTGSLRLAATMLIVAAVGAALGAALATAAGPDSSANERLATAVSVMSELARDPQTRQVVLSNSAGVSAGVAFVSATSGRLAIFTSSIAADGLSYSCYLERGSGMTELGPMHVVDDVAFWAGPISAVPGMGQAGDRLVVATDEDGEPALIGAF